MQHLTDDEAAGARYCIAEVIRLRRLTGQPIPAWLRSLACAMSSPGPEKQVVQSDSSKPEIGSAQAAKIIGCSRRHISRIHTDLDGRMVAGRWVFNEDAVLEYAREKKEKNDGY